MNVRRACAADLEAVLAVHRRAFGRDEEAELAAGIVESREFPPELPGGRVVYPRTFR